MKGLFEYIYYYLRDASIVGFRMITGAKTRPNGKLFKKMVSASEGNELIAKLLQSDEPFAVGRLGATETFNINEYFAINYKLKSKMNPKYLERLHINSGFYPATEENVKKFCKLFLDSMSNMDVLPTYRSFMEEYIIKHYAPKNVILSEPHAYEPYFFEHPWSKYLAGKKVLVVSPFSKSIEEQYSKKRTELFENKDTLPAFELKTIQAVQSIAGNVDPRFPDWFKALDYMHEETLKIDYDVAIVGCGVYALPLSSMIKNDGKQVIMMCGSTQYLFGIKTGRADNNPILNQFYNDNWVYPTLEETPSNSNAVEDGCYWSSQESK